MLRRKSIPAEWREGLARGRLLGTFLKIASLETVEITISAGFDFAIVDLEHSQLSMGEGLRLIRHGFALGLPVAARIPTVDRGAINRLLEAGASGIQLSGVRSTAQVRDLVSATRYPPAGSRSVSLAQPVAGYGALTLREAVEADPPLLIAQIESTETDDPLDELLSGGVDVAFIGPTDLLVEVGFDRGRLAARIEEIAKAAVAAGVVLGAYASGPADVPEGANYVALSSDLSVLQSATADSASAAKDIFERRERVS